MRTVIALVLMIVALSAATLLAFDAQKDALVWDHFDVVEPGVLYRSGQLSLKQLEEAVHRYGIRTVVSFLVPGPDVDAERKLARSLKIDFVNLPMSGDGAGEEAQFREVLAICGDPASRPVLIHCARGTCRTGAAVALYRFEHQGWTVEDVGWEMQRHTYKNGWLPGYVYRMVREKPFAEIFQPAISRERNLPASETQTHDAR